MTRGHQISTNGHIFKCSIKSRQTDWGVHFSTWKACIFFKGDLSTNFPLSKVVRNWIGDAFGFIEGQNNRRKDEKESFNSTHFMISSSGGECKIFRSRLFSTNFMINQRGGESCFLDAMANLAFLNLSNLEFFEFSRESATITFSGKWSSVDPRAQCVRKKERSYLDSKWKYRNSWREKQIKCKSFYQAIFFVRSDAV